MIYGEWNWDEALAVAKEEGVEEGIDIGEKRGVRKGVRKGVKKGVKRRDEQILGLIEKGYSSADIENFLRR
ncbi:hypothetical protein R83H12_02771 [Fibrobacteria bacterium R8-3-H12]